MTHIFVMKSITRVTHLISTASSLSDTDSSATATSKSIWYLLLSVQSFREKRTSHFV